MGSFLSTEGETTLAEKRLAVLRELTKRDLETNREDRVSLARRGLMEIDNSWKPFLCEKELVELDLSFNRIVNLPSLSTTQLRRFCGKRNRFSGDVILALSLSAPTLTYLDLSWNYIQSFPISSFSLFLNVSYLDLSHNPLTVLPQELTFLSQLSTLKVNESALKTADVLPYLTSLRTLELAYNPLLCSSSSPQPVASLPASDLPTLAPTPEYCLPSLQNITNLTSLSLSHSKNVKTLTDLHYCSSLSYLDLSGLLLESLPNSFSSLSSLTFLHLAPNQFLEFPPVISTLTSLRHLTFGGTQCDNIPTGILGGLTNLTFLSLRFNYLTTVPSDIYRLTSLLTLDLAGNSFTTFPRDLRQLRNLQILNFSFNQLTNIEDFFFVFETQEPENEPIFPNLYLASFEGNKFTSVPENNHQFHPSSSSSSSSSSPPSDSSGNVSDQISSSSSASPSSNITDTPNQTGSEADLEDGQQQTPAPRNRNIFNVDSLIVYNPENCPYHIPPTNVDQLFKVDPITKVGIKPPSGSSSASSAPNSTEKQSFSFSSSSSSSSTSSLSSSTSGTPSSFALLPSFSHLQEEQVFVKKLRIKDQILGCIFGHALGDAVGLASEFMAKEQSNFAYGLERPHLHKFVRDKHRVRWFPGDWTDDTDQMLLIMDNLIYNSGKPDHILYARQLHGWALAGFTELGDDGGLGIGSTTHAILSNKDFETDPHRVAYTVWNDGGRNLAPNGGVMRTSILGIPSFHLRNVVIENTLKICQTTHYDQRCQSSCVAVTVAISMLLNGFQNIEAIVQQSYASASTLIDNEEMKEELSRYMMDSDWPFLNLSQRSSIGYTFKAMGAGFYCLRTFDDFAFAMSQIVRQAGDADSNGAVAGALLGTRFGLSNLPSDWLSQLTHGDWLYSRAHSFLDIFPL